MKLKRLTALLVAAALSLSLSLAGCGGDSASAGESAPAPTEPAATQTPEREGSDQAVILDENGEVYAELEATDAATGIPCHPDRPRPGAKSRLNRSPKPLSAGTTFRPVCSSRSGLRITLSALRPRPIPARSMR